MSKSKNESPRKPHCHARARRDMSAAAWCASVACVPPSRRKARPARQTRETKCPRATADTEDAQCGVVNAESFRFEGTKRLYGDTRFAALKDAHVVVLGMGGVGSWAVEALARSGVGALTLVDLDFVCVTNVNRQVLALSSTVGEGKADVMRARVLDINPECDVRVVNDFVNEGNVEQMLGFAKDGELFASREGGTGAGDAEGKDDDASPSTSMTAPIRKPVDFVLDAVDSENDKAAIVAACVHHRVPVLVAGGAGGIDSFGDVIIEDLANATFNRLLQRARRVLRRDYKFPKGNAAFPGAAKKSKRKDGKFGVAAVYVRENGNYFAEQGTKGRGGIGCDGVGGSAVFVTGAIGFKAASHIVVRLMEIAEAENTKDEDEDTHNAKGPATTGWRSRVWPKTTSRKLTTQDLTQEMTQTLGGGGGEGNDGNDDDGNDDDEDDENHDGEGNGNVFAKSAPLAAGVFAVAAGGETFEDVAGNDNEGDVSTDIARSVAARTGDVSTDSTSVAAPVRRTSFGIASVVTAENIDASEIFDAHCHWHLGGDVKSCAALATRLAGAAFTSTEPPDWVKCAEAGRVASANSKQPGYCVALGVHPWWAHKHLLRDNSTTWPTELRALLETLPSAIVGEIGLDRVAVPLDENGRATGEPVDYENQLKCFELQLDIATELHRPVAVHCVRAFGDVFDMLRGRTENPPRILMHSFGGTAGYLTSLVKMKTFGNRFYFGFSKVVNLASPKTRQVIQHVPHDKLLIESDLVDSGEAEKDLRAMLLFVAETKGWSVSETARITRENAERFYG